jgi:hypothetical protein
MASILPPKKCPVLPDGGILTAAFVGMDKDRFSPMFIKDHQVICTLGSDCKICPRAGSINESIHCCMNCTLKFHSCITCSGVRFADWLSGAAAGREFSASMLSEYGQEKFNHNNDNFSSSLLELCSYCQKSITLSINANPGPAGDVMGTSVESISVDSAGFAPSCEEHYQNNNNLLRILVTMCHGLKNKDGSDLVNFDRDPWASLKVSMCHPNLGKWRNDIRRRARINIATKQSTKVSKKGNPLPSQWTITKCQQWLEAFPITDPSGIIFLCSEMHVRLKVTTAAVEQKRSEEQRLQNHDDENYWYGNNPILCLIHTLDEMEIGRAYMGLHDLSNKPIVVNNMKSVEKRKETV